MKKTWMAVFLIVALLLPPLSIARAESGGNVVINEIAWMGMAASTSDEWLELYNPANQEVNLAGWYIEDDDGAQIYTISSGIMGAYSYFLIEDAEETTSVFADSVVISPSERYIAEAEFELPGTYRILNRNPSEERVLGRILVEGSGRAAEENNQSASAAFGALHENPQISDSMAPFLDYPDEPADFTYDLTVDIPGATPLDELGRELMELGHDGIEWEDTMFGMNQLSTNASVRWIIRDNRTGRDNMDAAAQAPKDRPIKLLIRNDKDSLHPMQHVVHIHGTRFLVSKTDGVPNKNLVWKDSVLVPVGGTVELLVSFPNAGKWMMHCHIAEHLESGMMTAFVVR